MMDEKSVIEKVKEFVEKSSKENDKGYHEEWMIHLNSVSKNAVELANDLRADAEVVEIAAWFHDIGSILYQKTDHHITGAKIAEEKLKELGYPEEKIEQVKHCIFSHRASKGIRKETIEAQILADADSMAHFDEFENLVKAETILGGNNDLEDARTKIQEKMERSWSRISPKGISFAIKKYFGTMELGKMGSLE